jgi:Tfp pilus assembly protein PilO
MRRLTAREKTMVSTAAAVAAAVALLLLVIVPAGKERAKSAAEIAELRSRLIGSHALVSGGRSTAEEVEALERSLKEREARLFSGEQASLLGARLQKLYKDMAEESGLTVKSEQILEAESVGGIGVIPVEITVGGTTEQLDRFLAAVDGYERRLTINRLSIRVPNILKPTQVTGVIRVSGYLLPEGRP